MVKDYLTLDELKALPDGSVILDRHLDAWQKDEGYWFAFGENPFNSKALFAYYQPIGVIWEGEDG